MPTVAIADMTRWVGREVASDWIEVSQRTIDQFAEATGDRQFIHVDPERAAATPLGGTIAHGFLTLSLLSRLIAMADVPRPEHVRMIINYGLDKVRFLSAVRTSARVRGCFTLQAFEEKRPGQYRKIDVCTVEIEGQRKPALVADWISQVLL